MSCAKILSLIGKLKLVSEAIAPKGVRPLGRKKATPFGKRVSRRASWTFPVFLMSLKYRFMAILNATGTKIVHGLRALAILFHAVHNRTSWRFPEFIAIKIGLKCLHLGQFFLQSHQLELEIRIRHLRIGYLHSKFAQRQFQIGICSALRLLEKRLNGLDTFSNPARGTPSIPDKLQNATQILEIEIQRFLQCKSLLRDANGRFHKSVSGRI